VRINPANAKVVPLGTTKPAQIAFAMDDVFIAGGKELLRIKTLSTQ
jgi:hypothetical protein